LANEKNATAPLAKMAPEYAMELLSKLEVTHPANRRQRLS
jgi:hypothetical protein